MAVNSIKGRGALSNSAGRFESVDRVAMDDGWDLEDLPPASPNTTVTEDKSKTVISTNTSPDVPFDQSVNPYRGCEHGCIYCFARPSHGYLGLSAGLDFEQKLFYKPKVAAQLREELSAPGYRCRVLALGTNTDPYQPIEKQHKLMRGIISLMLEARHPVTITTKSALVERDIDLLQKLAADSLVMVSLSVTSLDHDFARKLEPRAAAPRRRLLTLSRLAQAGIPVHISVAPVIPAMTDHEMEKILELGASAGAEFATYTLLRLPWEVKDLFKEWLVEHYPTRADHVMSLVRQSRGGKEYDSDFATRRRGTGPFADLIANRFKISCDRLGLNKRPVPLQTNRFLSPRGQKSFAF